MCWYSISTAVTAWCLMSDGVQLILGMKNGGLRFFDVRTFSLPNRILDHEILIKKLVVRILYVDARKKIYVKVCC